MNRASQYRIIALLFAVSAVCSGRLAAQIEMLRGEVSAEAILDNDRIYRIYHERYEISEEALNALNTYPDSAEIIVFFGTWCKESKKYVPALIKVYQAHRNQNIQWKFVAAGPDKKIPEAFSKMFSIEYIPTVVVLKNNIEAGRIEEHPRNVVEADLVQILRKTEIRH